MNIGTHRGFKPGRAQPALNGSKVLRLAHALGSKPDKFASRLDDADALTDAGGCIKRVGICHALNTHGEITPHRQAANMNNI